MSDDRRCKTCEHFQGDDNEDMAGRGSCGRILELTDITENWRDRETLNKEPAFIYAIQERSWLEVSPDFGCVLWEERKADDAKRTLA